MQENLLRSFLSATPEHRRHAKFSFGTLFIPQLASELGGFEKAVDVLLGENQAVWSTFTGPDLVDCAHSINMAGMIVDSLAPADARAMHVNLLKEGGYLGAIQVSAKNPAHWDVFENAIGAADFRVYGDELRVFCRGFEVAASDERDHLTFNHWKEVGIFSSVRWEDVGVAGSIFDQYYTYEHAGRVAELEDMLSGQLTFVLHEVLMRASELDPDLMSRLHAAIKAFEHHDTAEQLAHVSLSCRRYIEKLADTLYPPRKERINGRDLGLDKYRNRLWAYISDRLDSGTAAAVCLANFKDLGERIDALSRAANKGLHDAITASDVNRLLMTLLVVSHDLLTLETPGQRVSYEPYRENIAAILKLMLETDSE